MSWFNPLSWFDPKFSKVPVYVPQKLDIYAREGKAGLETFSSGDLEKLNPEVKRQLEHFFLAVIERFHEERKIFVDSEVPRPKVKGGK